MRKLPLSIFVLLYSCSFIPKEGQFEVYNPYEEAYYLKIYQGNEAVFEESLSDSSLNEAILLIPGESYLFKLKKPYKDSDKIGVSTYSAKKNEDNEYELIKSSSTTIKFMKQSLWTEWKL